VPHSFRTEHASGGKGWQQRPGLVRTQKKNCGTHAFNLASSTQRGKDGGEEGLVLATSHGGLGWLQASWTQQNLAEHNIENCTAWRDQC